MPHWALTIIDLFHPIELRSIGMHHDGQCTKKVYTRTKADIKWLVLNCVEVFILHQDIDAIGYCSHFIGPYLSVGKEFRLISKASPISKFFDIYWSRSVLV